MSISHPLPPKKEVALALLERSNDRGIFVHLDPRQAAVVVPPWFKKQPQLVLQIGLNMPVPIPDLRLDDDGMSCTLSFNRSPFFCAVPWAAVFAMVGEDGRGMVWPDDVPAEVPLARQGQAPSPPPVRAVDGMKKDHASDKATTRAGAGAGAAKARRPRKRATIAAVPDVPSAARKAKADKPVKGEATAATRPAAASKRPAPSAGRASEGGSKKKRELPPYLRVVK
jgi:stringent starvation protein B